MCELRWYALKFGVSPRMQAELKGVPATQRSSEPLKAVSRQFRLFFPFFYHLLILSPLPYDHNLTSMPARTNAPSTRTWGTRFDSLTSNSPPAPSIVAAVGDHVSKSGLNQHEAQSTQLNHDANDSKDAHPFAPFAHSGHSNSKSPDSVKMPHDASVFVAR